VSNRLGPREQGENVDRAGSKFGRVAVVAALLSGVVISITGGPAAAATTVSGRARGEGVQAIVLGGNTVVHLSEAKSEIDNDGIGVGTNVANGTAKPAEVVASGVTTLRAADSATSAPPSSSDSDGVPSANLPGVLTVSALSSGSSADSLPRSTNSARIEESSVLTTLVKTGIVTGASESRRAGDDSLSTASAQVASVSVNALGIPTIKVGVTSASASALATGVAPNLPGGSKGQVLSCNVASVTIGTTSFLNIPCDGRDLVQSLPALLRTTLTPLLSIKAGSPSVSQTATSATAKVDALTITIKLTGQKIILGSVDVAAEVGAADTASPCVFPARPTASGSAAGDVVKVSDLLTGTTADVALSQVKIDEAGVAGGPKSATADGITAQVAQPTVPVLTQVVDTHATAPPGSSQSVTVADATIAPLVSSQTVHADAAANANPDGFAPNGAAHATAEHAGANVGPLVSLDSTTIASSATSTRNPSNVTSAGSASVENTTGTIAGLPLDIQALQSTANASATGSPGGASATNSYQFLRVRLGGLVLNSPPPAGSTFDVVSGLTLVRLTFGAGNTTTAADGTSASASMDALRIQVLPLGGGAALETVVIAHSEAAAKVPGAGFAGFISKRIAVAFDEPRTFTDGPVRVAPGQKFTYLICYANLGTTTLDQFVITDVLNGALAKPYDALFPLPPNTAITGGTPFNGTTLGGTLTSAPFSLGPGQSGSLQLTMEVVAGTAPGAVINNTATLTRPGGSATSNNVAINVGYGTNSPALSGSVQSTGFNSTTRIFTVTFLATNNAQAGTAFGAEVVTIATTNGVGVATPLGAFPIALGDIAPGGSSAFTVQFHIPNGVTNFNYDLLFQATGADGHKYLFD